MGKLLLDEHKNEKRSKYDYYNERRDWYVGSLDRFKYKIAWIENDTLGWDVRDNWAPRVEIRKFIEETCIGEVYVTSDTCNYWGGATDEDRSKTVSWISFNFEKEEDLALFILKFMERANNHLCSLTERKKNAGTYCEIIQIQPFDFIDAAIAKNKKEYEEYEEIKAEAIKALIK